MKNGKFILHFSFYNPVYSLIPTPYLIPQSTHKGACPYQPNPYNLIPTAYNLKPIAFHHVYLIVCHYYHIII